MHREPVLGRTVNEGAKHVAEPMLAKKAAATPLPGLSEQEVRDRRARGMGNSAPPSTSRSYRQIIVENVLNFINLCLFGLGVTLALLGRISDALVSIGVISLNVIVSVTQEVRAKQTLDAIAVLTRPTATVVREGHEREVPPENIVVGDTLKLGPGDQIVVDGRVLGEEGTSYTVDESLLTGEADLVLKRPGDVVYSGSFCVTGGGYYVAEHVGAGSLAQQITADARAFRRVLTPLQQEINLVVRIAILIVLYLEFLLIVKSVLQRVNLAESVENSTIVAALVPNGLFLSIAVAYALGAVRILRFGALVQQANAIESLSHVDVLCLDKTGTLTANRLTVSGVYSLGSTTKQEVERVLGTLAASASGGNKTSEAIQIALPHPKRQLAGEIPFSSARKWSAVELTHDKEDGRADGRPGETRNLGMPDEPVQDAAHELIASQPLRCIYALGAPEMLRPYLRNRSACAASADQKGDAAGWPAIEAQVRALAERGLRVLLVARSTSAVTHLENRGDASVLPADMEPLGLVALGDELRPEARETLHAFADAGVHLKIISGDNAETVAALARQAGLDPSVQLVSGSDLDAMDEAMFDATAASATIFGRITPQQKARLVRALRQRGHYVAMIGDGVNDVISLKQANLGIALRSGSQAARGVADLVLMQDSFAVLAPAVAEGQRIQNGMHDILNLFLTRISTVGLVIFSSLVIGAFPLELRQSSAVTLFSVGIPAIVLAVWARPGPSPQGSLMRRLLYFVLPPVVLSSALGLLVFVGVYALRLVEAGAFASRTAMVSPEDMPIAQTTLTAFLVYCGLALVIFVEPPTSWWVGGNTLSGDWRPTVLAVGMMLAFSGVLVIPPLRSLFVLSPLGLQEYGVLAATLVIWLVCLRATWRLRLLSRYLDADLG